MTVGCLLQKDLGKNHVQYFVCCTMRAWSSLKWYSVIQFNETKASGFVKVQNYKSRHKEQAT
jgi:hypothetical protein